MQNWKAYTILALWRLSAPLPLPWLHALGTLLGWGLGRFNTRARQVTQRNLALCFPTHTPRAREQLARSSLIETGKTMLESGALWFRSPARTLSLVRRISGAHLLVEAHARGRGVIIAAPHLGAWELVGLYCSLHYPMTSLYRPPRLAALDTQIRAARARGGAQLVPTDAGGVRALYRALQRGGLVGILPDQEPREGEAVFAPFFGVPAKSMVLLPRLARKTGATVLLVYAERLPYGRGFHLHFEAAPEEVGAGEGVNAVACVNALVESAVRRYPAQYQWSYKRFLTAPPGAAERYR